MMQLLNTLGGSHISILSSTTISWGPPGLLTGSATMASGCEELCYYPPTIRQGSATLSSFAFMVGRISPRVSICSGLIVIQTYTDNCWPPVAMQCSCQIHRRTKEHRWLIWQRRCCQE